MTSIATQKTLDAVTPVEPYLFTQREYVPMRDGTTTVCRLPTTRTAEYGPDD